MVPVSSVYIVLDPNRSGYFNPSADAIAAFKRRRHAIVFAHRIGGGEGDIFSVPLFKCDYDATCDEYEDDTDD